MEKTSSKKIKIIGMLVVAAVIAIFALIFIINRITPTKEKMSGYKYFGVEEGTQDVLVIVDGEKSEDYGIKADGRFYISQKYVADNINVRFYYDNESNSVLYTDKSNIYSFSADKSGYTDDKGTTYSTDYPVMRVIDGEAYLDWEYVASYTNCEYEYGDEPSRVNITLSHDERECVVSKKKVSIRYRAGIKSPVLETVDKDVRLIYVDEVDDWTRVTTPSGMTGYLKTSDVTQKSVYVPDNTYEDNYEYISYDGKINMAWYQVTGTAGNAYVNDNLPSGGGVNVISPTWYSIKDASGSMDCYATSQFVNEMHSKGIKVWALVDDFNKDIDFKALYSSAATRANMINRLISDAARYGFDGINLDFENVRNAYSQDYLQFIRELSIKCKENSLVLSIDNYKPEAYNSCYNIKEQSAFADYIIIMAYDEHYAGSAEAGSVASLPFVKEAIEDTVAVVPSERVIVGIPFFTRIWTINGQNVTSRAVSMQTALDTLNSNKATAIWNDDAGQYVGSFENSSGTVKIWFEEEKSIEEKMKLVKEYNTAGTSAWKLGLERYTVWSVINKYLE